MTKKNDKELIDKIIEIYEQKRYPIRELCKMVDITPETFYRWQEENDGKNEFCERLKMAKLKYLKSLAELANDSLQKLVSGFDVQETSTIYIAGDKDDEKVIKEQKITTKHFTPNTAAVIFALSNQDSENFQNRMTSDGTIKQEITDLSKYTYEQLYELKYGRKPDPD